MTPSSEGRIQPDQPRRLLLMIRSARPTLAEVPLADLSFGPRKPRDRAALGRFAVGTQHVPDCLDHVSKARGIEHAARAAIQIEPRQFD